MNNLITQLLNRNKEVPDITPVIVDNTGNIDPIASAQAKMQNTPLTLKDRLFGRELSTDVLKTDPETGNSEMISAVNYRPGFFNDVASVYKENYNNSFNFNNLAPQKKGIATRIGEGLGTIGRFIDSPLGRGLMAYGLNNYLGYDDSVKEGLMAAVGRQNAQTADKIYRQQLEQQGIDTSNISGNINNDIYHQILYGQQLKENAEYRQMYLENQQKQNEAMNQLRQDQLLYQKQKAAEERADRAATRALTRRGQDLNYSLGKERIEANKNKIKEDKSIIKELNSNSQTLADIEAGIQLIEENPQAYSWLKGKLGADVANRIDPKGVPARTQIDNITAVYRKWLTGAQMSDAERKAYERFLPAPTDNAQIVKAKLNGMKNSIERKNQILMQNIQPMQNNYDDDDMNPLDLDL